MELFFPSKIIRKRTNNSRFPFARPTKVGNTHAHTHTHMRTIKHTKHFARTFGSKVKYVTGAYRAELFAIRFRVAFSLSQGPSALCEIELKRKRVAKICVIVRDEVLCVQWKMIPVCSVCIHNAMARAEATWRMYSDWMTREWFGFCSVPYDGAWAPLLRCTGSGWKSVRRFVKTWEIKMTWITWNKGRDKKSWVDGMPAEGLLWKYYRVVWVDFFISLKTQKKTN